LMKAGKSGGHAGKGKSQEPGSAEWAAAVVKKAMPKMVESLIKAAQQCSESRAKAEGAKGDEEGESLTALLLRLLKTSPAHEGSAGAKETAAE
jgi:hypothetical protein